MRPGVDVRGVAFEGGAVAGLGLHQFALLEEEVAELGVMVRLVEVMDLGFELLDAAAVERARQLKPAGCRGCGPIDEEIVKGGGDAPVDKDEDRNSTRLNSRH